MLTAWQGVLSRNSVGVVSSVEIKHSACGGVRETALRCGDDKEKRTEEKEKRTRRNGGIDEGELAKEKGDKETDKSRKRTERRRNR